MKFKSIKDQYIKLLSDYIIVSVDDLTENEAKLISKSFILFQEKLDDIKILSDENRRISIQLANLKASLDDNEYSNEDE